MQDEETKNIESQKDARHAMEHGKVPKRKRKPSNDDPDFILPVSEQLSSVPIKKESSQIASQKKCHEDSSVKCADQGDMGKKKDISSGGHLVESADDLPLVYLKYAIKPCSVSIMKSDSLISQPEMSSHIGVPQLSEALDIVERRKIKLSETVVTKQMLRLAQGGGRSGIYDDNDDDEDPQEMVNECAQCGFKSTSLTDHLKHVSSHDPLYCILCDKYFDKEDEMDCHRQSAHSLISCANIIQVDDAVNASEHLVILFMTQENSPKKAKESAAIAWECSNFQHVAVKDLLSEEECLENPSVILATSSVGTSSTSEVSEVSNKEDTRVSEDESDSGMENKTVETVGSEMEDKCHGTSNKEQTTRVSEDESNTRMEKKIEETGGSEIEDKYEGPSNKQEDTKVSEDKSDTTSSGSEIENKYDEPFNKEQETRVSEDE